MISKDYPLIPMSEIEDEARRIAVAWHENATDWIGDKHKLASDIMNYAANHADELRKENERLRGLIEDAYIAGRNDEKSKSEMMGWQQFKKENNL